MQIGTVVRLLDMYEVYPRNSIWTVVKYNFFRQEYVLVNKDGVVLNNVPFEILERV